MLKTIKELKKHFGNDVSVSVDFYDGLYNFCFRHSDYVIRYKVTEKSIDLSNFDWYESKLQYAIKSLKEKINGEHNVK